MKLTLCLPLLMAVSLASCAHVSSETRSAETQVAEPAPGSPDAAALESLIASWVRETGFNGVVGIAHLDRMIVNHASGTADWETGRALTPDSVFQTGSVGKFFAAIVAFAMAERGLVDLDAPISTYLPDYRADIASRVTLAHLLTSRSGINGSYGPVMGGIIGQLQADPDAALESLVEFATPMDEGIENYASGDLKFEPGSEFDYANANWVLVHRILENAAGKNFETILRRYVFDPAGMTGSGVFVGDLTSTSPAVANVAIGQNLESEQHNGDYPLPTLIGGGSFTTAQNMVRLMHALYGGELLNADSLARFSTVETPEEGYAYGGRISPDDDDPAILYSMQSGSNGATNMVTVHEIGGDYSYVLLSNNADEQSDMFAMVWELRRIAERR